VFGIVMEDQVDFAEKTPPPPAPAKKVPHRGKRRKRAVPADPRAQILALIGRSPDGISARRIQQETGIDIVKIRNTIAVAHKKGTIERVSRGVYRQTAPRLTPAEEKTAVLSFVNDSSTGVSVPDIKEKTGLPASRVRYIVSRAFARGEIRRISRGRYAGKSNVRRKGTVVETVYQAIRRSRKGLTIAQLREKTDLGEIALRNAVYRLYKQGRIQRPRRGTYTLGDVLK
jgi:predicted transcriptional regulator of viral defense system